jgi:2-dehydro-3-deoxygluconokinase
MAGDTLNTAVYLARLGVGADYVTALGDDSLSDEMIAGWAAEGVGTSRWPAAGKLPGLYMIQTDDRGERGSFTGATALRPQPDGFAADAGDPEFAGRL